MTSEQERPGAADGLVALYAERLQSRCRTAPRPVHVRPAPSLYPFGRGPRLAARRGLTLPRGVTVGALVATALVVGSQAAAASTTHQVQDGETLGGIADSYSVSVEQLARLNSIADPNLIITGSVLTIDDAGGAYPAVPTTSTPVAVPPPDQDGVKHHHVLKGESLSLIADRYGVTVAALAAANDILDPNVLQVDTDLLVPAVGSNSTQTAQLPASSSNLALHLVAPGETLSVIAAQYGVTYQALANANALLDPNQIEVGQLLRVPGASPVQQSGVVKLRGMPVQQQSLPLSCEAAAVSMATAYWGHQVSEWVFIENLPTSPNPHLGFRGSVTGAFGSTSDYGVYAEPFVPLLDRYGFVGDVFYADGDASLLKEQLQQGTPVVVWLTNMTSAQTRTYAWADGNRFALVPQEHAVVVYGYDDNRVFVADPGDGALRQFDWDDFIRSWGYFDGMSLAVYPRA
jgi:LysM repeat protein